ncbi:hypothetical protein X566_20165 [Afipia sp. P52-10]|uniref:hypothetical protein n=1 Tax=Afipia sp. P52-10 TaxID=1429916 RepID=UPI0003DF2A12|nr:hypothetical protein [Afipia sp. P52-10]ETR75071.1 hypothetical protein X566_20165 [Afipia sp. P52-10]
MRTFDPATLAALEAGLIDERDMILFDFPSGLYGFWAGREPMTYQGVQYRGGGGLIQVDAIAANAGLASFAVTLRLSAIPNTELTPDLLATIEQEQYHQRPVTLSVAYIDKAARALISVERIFRGYLDVINHEQEVGALYTLVMKLESKSRDHTRRGYRMRGNADQRLIDANDGGLRHVGRAGETVLQWGRVHDRPVAIADARMK